jgi:hypothetical protein
LGQKDKIKWILGKKVFITIADFRVRFRNYINESACNM